MASLEVATAPSAEKETSKETEISPAVEETFSPANPKDDDTEGTVLTDEEDGQEFDEEKENKEELCPINQEAEATVSFEGSGFAEFNEGEDKEDGDDDEDEDV